MVIIKKCGFCLPGNECCLVCFNTLRPRWNEQHFADDIFKRIFFNENVWISIKISLKFVCKGLINNIPALVQIMAWRRSGIKPLSEPMMVSFPCVGMCVAWIERKLATSFSKGPISLEIAGLFGLMVPHWAHNGGITPGDHWWCHYPGTLSFSQVSTIHLKIEHICMKSRVPYLWINSNDLTWR